MKAASQTQVDAINKHLDRLPERQDLKDELQEHEAAIETKATKASIRTRTIDLIYTLVDCMRRMEIGQRSLET